MREILFRGKHKYIDGKVGEWVYGSLSVMSGGGHAFIIDHKADYIYEVEPATVGQYTGLEDCKGMRIYEGDVLDWTDDDDITDRVVAKFKDGRFIVELIDGSTLSLYSANDEAKVIGNIYDNPELMEG